MGKIIEILKNLFTIQNLMSGIYGIIIGVVFIFINNLIQKSSFGDVLVFIGVGVGFVFTIFFLGLLLNKTLFKDED